MIHWKRFAGGFWSTIAETHSLRLQSRSKPIAFVFRLSRPDRTYWAIDWHDRSEVGRFDCLDAAKAAVESRYAGA